MFHFFRRVWNLLSASTDVRRPRSSGWVLNLASFESLETRALLAATLVKDINSHSNPLLLVPNNLRTVNGTLYFATVTFLPGRRALEERRNGRGDGARQRHPAWSERARLLLP